MKYLLLFAIVFAAFLLWRNNRQAARDAQDARAHKAPRQAAGQPQDMIACAFCDVHIPRTDALPGPGGKLFCCAEHRQRSGG